MWEGRGSMSLFLILKWLHVLFAILAVGANATYGIWLARAKNDRAILPHTLRTIKILDDRLANPAYGMLLLTGLAMVLIVPLPLTTPWIMAGLILYAILLVLGLFGYTPTLKRQIALAESAGPDSAEYQAMARRGMILGIVLAVIAVAIVFVMVTKPVLWGAI